MQMTPHATPRMLSFTLTLLAVLSYARCNFNLTCPFVFKPSCHGSFDVVLSDMAPSTSGIKLLDANASHELCEQAIQIAQTVLKPHGTLVMKVFHGSGFAPVLKRVQSCFGQTHTVKPASTRGESVETFIVGRNFKPKGNKNTSDKEKKEKAHASKLATAAQSSNRRGGNQR